MIAHVWVANAKAHFASLVARAGREDRNYPEWLAGRLSRPLVERRPIQYGDLRGIALADDLSLPEDVNWGCRADPVISILVDTHFFLWVRITPERLSFDEREALDNARFRFVSAVSLWEIAILMAIHRVGRDLRPFDLPDGFDLLPIRPEHCKELLGSPGYTAIRSISC